MTLLPSSPAAPGLRERISAEFAAAAQTLHAVQNDAALLAAVAAAAEICVTALRSGGKLLLAGNGGSAADAQHVAAEIVARYLFERPGLPAIALTTDSSILTAVGNDYGFEQLFARQLEALGRPGDVFIAYSTSGNSPNILRALDVARAQQLHCIGMTGNRRGAMVDRCTLCIEVPSAHTPRIQEAHALIGHTLCGLIEEALFR